MRRLRESFRPEFLNRIDEIIVFTPAQTRRSCGRSPGFSWRTPAGGCMPRASSLHFTQAAVDWIADRGYEPEFGARPMRRVIQREVDNPLSRMLLDGEIRGGQEVTVDVRGDRLVFERSVQHAGV